MTKFKKKILLITIATLILGTIYILKDVLKIFVIQQQAINNYNNKAQFFDSLRTFKATDIYYSIELKYDEFVSIQISNFDQNFIDSISILNNESSSKKIEKIKLIKLNQIDCSEIPQLENKLLLQNEDIYKNWEIHYLGLITDNILKIQLQNLKVNYEEFINQIKLTRIVNCSRLEMHNEGIELYYKKKIKLKSGCLIRDHSPIKYNIGTKYLLRNNLVKFKNLGKNVQCYIAI